MPPSEGDGSASSRLATAAAISTATGQARQRILTDVGEPAPRHQEGLRDQVVHGRRGARRRTKSRDQAGWDEDPQIGRRLETGRDGGRRAGRGGGHHDDRRRAGGGQHDDRQHDQGAECPTAQRAHATADRRPRSIALAPGLARDRVSARPRPRSRGPRSAHRAGRRRAPNIVHRARPPARRGPC
jgi:hypothetical protein